MNEEAEGEEADEIQSTKLRLHKSFRVLVEVTANDELPHTLEISYPPISDMPVRIDVNANNFAASKSNVINDDVFVTVGKNNKPIGEKSNVKQGDVDLSNFKPKVLVWGFGSYGSIDSILGETVPIANSYQALDDQVIENNEKSIEAAMENEYENVIWPKLKEDVTSIIESGVYPWMLERIGLFTKEGGMADEVRPEYVDGCGQDQGNCVASDAILFPMIELFSWNIKVKKKNLNRVYSNVIGNWHWVSNNDVCVNGTGIIIGWDPQPVRVMVLNQTSQLMDLFVETMNGQQSFFCLYFYAHIRSYGRKSLWRVLVLHSLVVKDRPWTLLGDFYMTNSARQWHVHELEVVRSGGRQR
nr:hypothetical protein [Tanacetum cinerariifolium]